MKNLENSHPARQPGSRILMTVTSLAFALCTTANAQSRITITDGNALSIKVVESQCVLRDMRSDDEQWIHLGITPSNGGGGADSNNRFEYRLGSSYGQPVEVLNIAMAGAEPYGPIALYDQLEAELMANIDTWSPEQIANQDDKIAAADGQPNQALRNVEILVDGTFAKDYFQAVRQAERFPTPRVASLSVRATDLPVANSEDFQAATIALDGRCNIQILSK